VTVGVPVVVHCGASLSPRLTSVQPIPPVPGIGRVDCFLINKHSCQLIPAAPSIKGVMPKCLVGEALRGAGKECIEAPEIYIDGFC